MDQNRVHRYTNIFTQLMTKKTRRFSGEGGILPINGAGSIGYPQEGEKKKLNPCLTLYIKINPRWIADLNVKVKKQIIYNKTGDLHDFRVVRHFLNTKILPVMEKIDKLD